MSEEPKHTPFPWTYCGEPGEPCICLTVHGEHHPIFSVERGEWGEHHGGDFVAYGRIDQEVAEANFKVILDALRKAGVIEDRQ
jgi:hypothetical protein